MQAIRLAGPRSAWKLILDDFPEPAPGPKQVLVRVAASSVNPKDWKLNQTLATALSPAGRLIRRPLFGDDLAGDVVAVGSRVEHLRVGDRVFGMDMRLRTAALAEYAVIDQQRVARIPDGIGYRDAAAAPLAAQTALQGLRIGGANAGSRVLLIGASGGVGTYAVQIARALGCHITAVCSGRNFELVKDLGADELIDYTQADFHRCGQRFNLVFDITSYETPRRCARLLTEQGQFVSTMGYPRALASTLLTRRPRSSLVVVESHTRDLEQIAGWMSEHKLRSVIDSVYPLAETQQAYMRSRSGRARGKILIEMG